MNGRRIAASLISRMTIPLALAVLVLIGGGACLRGDDADEKAESKPEATGPIGKNPFPGRFPAPGLEGGVEWLNTDGEIALEELRGKVVLLDFWTYCCINCIHILPDLKYLEQKYANQLVVIGVHAPKFENEKDTENIRNAILRYEIEHPVVNDANMTIARNYAFSSWPTLVLIDPEGNFVGRQSGEGNRELFDNVIGKMVDYHRKKGTLDENPVRFNLERDKVRPGALHYPGKLLADEASNRLFISDSNNNRIVISSLDGRLVDVVGTGEIGAQDGGYAEATFDHPQGMALVGDTLYVADTENHLLRTIDLNNKTVATLAGTGEQAHFREPGGALPTTPLNSPWDLQELDGVLYIAMAGPHQLWMHELGSKFVKVFAGSGREDILDGPLAASALAQPSGITTDGEFLYHVDSEGSAVRQVSRGRRGTVTTVVGPHDIPQGQALFTFGDVDGVGDNVRLQHPIGLVYHDGGLFVTDSYNHKIKHVDIKTRRCETWLGTGEQGAGLDPVELFEPAGVAVAGGKLLIADTNNHRILSADLKTKAVREFVVEGLQPPRLPEPADAEASGPEAAEVAVQKIKAGKTLRFEIRFKLPDEFKLNPLAPVTYKLTAVGDQSLVAADQLDARDEAPSEGLQATVDIPLTAQAGAATYELAINYSYCREGTGGVCRFGKQSWRIPVEVAADAAAESISLTVEP